YDEKSGDLPLTIGAKEGELMPDPDLPGHEAKLRLHSGEIHRQGETHTKISFDVYDVRFSSPLNIIEKAKTPPSLTMNEVRTRLQEPDLEPEARITLQT